MRHFGEQVLMKGGQIASMPIKELFREIDVDEEENEHIAKKFKEQEYLVDKLVRKKLEENANVT